MEKSKLHFIDKWLDKVSASLAEPRTPESTASTASPDKPRFGMKLRGRKPRPPPAIETKPATMAPGKRKATRPAPKGESATKRTRTQPDDQDIEATEAVPSVQLETLSHGTHPSTFSHYFNAMTASHQRFYLTKSTPRVLFVPGSEPTKPQTVQDLLRRFLRGMHADIPDCLKVLTKQQYPDEILPPSWYEDLPTTAPTPAQSLLWDVVVSTFNRATSLQGQFPPEFSWQEYIRNLLQAWIDIAGDKTLQADHISTARIADESLVPYIEGHPVFKKVNIAISFSPDSPSMSHLLRNISPLHALCQSDAANIAGCPQLVALELKSPDGSYAESSIELGIWMAAGYARLSQLQALAARSPGELIPPIVGLSVVGHVWSLHVTCKTDNDTVCTYGPYYFGNTASCLGVFQIFAVLDEICDWGKTEYAAWLKDEILTPLAARNVASAASQAATEAGPSAS